MKKLLCIIEIIALCFGCIMLFASCDSGKTEEITSEISGEYTSVATESSKASETTEAVSGQKETYETMNITDIKDKIKVYGRTSMLNSGITCDWSASGIEFAAECGGFVFVNMTSTADAYFTVFVDGVRQNEFVSVKKGTNKNLCIASSLEYGEHNIRLLKASHIGHANTVIESIRIKGVLLEKPTDREILIEFIGDSITCGTSVLANSSTSNTDVGTYKYCDATSSYSYLTAEKLGADWNVMGMSGSGIIKGWGDGNIATQRYFEDTFTRGSTAYDFSLARVPDVVVINLGTNDESIGVASNEVDTLKQTVKTFIGSIREKYGEDMPIVWAHGMMNDGVITLIKSAIEDMNGEANGIYVVQLTKNRDGGNGHPNASGMNVAAEELSAYIKNNVLK